MSRILFAILAFVLVGCAAPSKITDFSQRSVAYAYIDLSDIPGNKLQGFQMRNLSVPMDERYYPMGWEKVGNGYVVYHAGFAAGSYEFDRLMTMSCAGFLCTNQINEFQFGGLGHGLGAAKVSKPGVTFAGCYAFKRTKRGFFRPGEFDTRKVKCPVSQNAMLSAMIPNLSELEDTRPAQRARAAMR